jgi:hypothetical protein
MTAIENHVPDHFHEVVHLHGCDSPSCEYYGKSATGPRKPRYVYVASSWRCAMQPMIISCLNAAGIPNYDFRNPPGRTGFSWKSVMPSFDIDAQLVHEDEYLAGLAHPIAEEGFNSDFDAMKRADTFVLVLPCGRSAHLELGWAVGAGKRTSILLDGPEVTPELMYKMVDFVATNVMDLLGWLGVED